MEFKETAVGKTYNEVSSVPIGNCVYNEKI